MAIAVITTAFSHGVTANCAGSSTSYHMNRRPMSSLNYLENRQRSGTPLIITNKCANPIYPGILTQSGNGPGTGGFELTTGSTRTLSVGEAWQGRVWGRTNCSFNNAGTGPSGGTGRACTTGDCGGVVNCIGTGEVPTTLAEWTLDTGSGQTFYDLSLVDGYNLPMAIVLHADSNSSLDAIPPNLTNPSCVGTAGNLAPQDFQPYANGDFLGTNASNPLPFDKKVTANQAASWCPSNLEVNPLNQPSSGVYTYPDGNVQRPPFDPCFSACAKNNQPSDCCTGSYDSPSACSPSAYSKAAKGVCPDAYSYAFDDQTSTFIIPAGAGFEVIFCPGGRSTNILATSKQQLTQLAQQGHVRRDVSPIPYSTPNVLKRGLDLTVPLFGLDAWVSDVSAADALGAVDAYAQGVTAEEKRERAPSELQYAPASIAKAATSRSLSASTAAERPTPNPPLTRRNVNSSLVLSGGAPLPMVSQAGPWSLGRSNRSEAPAQVTGAGTRVGNARVSSVGPKFAEKECWVVLATSVMILWLVGL